MEHPPAYDDGNPDPNEFTWLNKDYNELFENGVISADLEAGGDEPKPESEMEGAEHFAYESDIRRESDDGADVEAEPRVEATQPEVHWATLSDNKDRGHQGLYAFKKDR